MRSLPFTILCLACFAVLMGVRFALEPLAARFAAPVPDAAAPQATMALPPKPEGLHPAGAGEGGSHTGAALLTLEACEAMPPDVRDVCLQALARQSAARDPQGALAVCARIAEDELAEECHSDVAEAAAPVDRAAAEAICRAVPSVKWRGQCHFGMGLAMAEIDAEYALARCAGAEIFQRFCRHDVVGEVALVDVDAAIAFCARADGDELMNVTCPHGIGKYLARRDLEEAWAACGRSPEYARGSCVHGLGWGGAERDVDATLAWCPAAGPWADNCRQGVAHQLKRFDATRAVALCESIATPTIHDACAAFLAR